MQKRRPKTIPITTETWQEDFRRNAMRTNFMLSLSQPMIEFLCAVADGVQWDRRDACSIHVPDNWIASERSLISFVNYWLSVRPRSAAFNS